MNIVKNLITDYFSANFTEDETEWQPLPTVYQNGDEARDGHYIYNYAGVNGTNSTTSPSITPLSWQEARASNYYAMLGDRTDQQTIVNGDLIIEIDISNYDTIALLNIKGTQVEIEMTDLDTMDIVFTDIKDLSNTEDIIDAYTHYFSPFVYFDRYYNRLPLFGNARVKITISALSGQSAIGRLVCGESYNVGISLFGASQNLSSYSKNVTNEFGTKSLVQEDVVYDSSYQILIPSAKVENVKRKRKEYAGVPVLFIGDPEVDSNFENLLSYGEWQNADILLNNPTNSTVSMTVKELL